MPEGINITKTFKVSRQGAEKIAEIMTLLGKDQESSVLRLLIEVGCLGVKVITNDDKAGDWKIPDFEQLSPKARSAILKILEEELPDKVEWIRLRNEALVMKDATELLKLLHQHPIHCSKWGTAHMKTIPWHFTKPMLECLQWNLRLLQAYSDFVEVHKRDPTDDELFDAAVLGVVPKPKMEEPVTT